MKKITVSRAKKKAWDWLSKYIRMKFADEQGYVSCVTCGLTRKWKDMQAGHFVARAQGNATYLLEENVHPQCYRCNMNLGGNGPEYTPYMVSMYGQEGVDELRRLSKTTRKFNVAELLEMADYFKYLAKEQAQRLGESI